MKKNESRTTIVDEAAHAQKVHAQKEVSARVDVSVDKAQANDHTNTSTQDASTHGAPTVENATFNEFTRACATYVKGREHACIGAVVGLLVALLIFSIGLFRTLLIGFCIALGIAIGQYVDGNPKILSLVQKLFKDNRN
ncbi:DUF2273 domain-containing protein [Fannyhessea vaginae]|jgi:hypothetical protein|uniref:DUF2273 domain-containing protein n=1 Tax=Fannyhessea vaginae TaxID=82135 RepID=UPI0026EEA11E|nr:DUF2273 domain-containing protein [Fannyhessea vaginae]